MTVKIQIWGNKEHITRLYSPGVAPGAEVVFSGEPGEVVFRGPSPFAGEPQLSIPCTYRIPPDTPLDYYFFHVHRKGGGKVRNLLLHVEDDGIDKVGFCLKSGKDGTATVRLQQWAPPGPLTISLEKWVSKPPVGLSTAGETWVEVLDRNDVILVPNSEITAGGRTEPLELNQKLSVHLRLPPGSPPESGWQSGGTEVVDILAEPVKLKS